jgi:hypothetical protein
MSLEEAGSVVVEKTIDSLEALDAHEFLVIIVVLSVLLAIVLLLAAVLAACFFAKFGFPWADGGKKLGGKKRWHFKAWSTPRRNATMRRRPLVGDSQQQQQQSLPQQNVQLAVYPPDNAPPVPIPRNKHWRHRQPLPSDADALAAAAAGDGAAGGGADAAGDGGRPLLSAAQRNNFVPLPDGTDCRIVS